MMAILSLPGSGSDWFVEQLRLSTDGVWATHHVHKEEFNPLCNLKHSTDLIVAGFACELVQTIDQLLNPRVDTERAMRVLDDSDSTVVKDVFNFAKAPWFRRHFDHVVILLRETSHTFPCTRLRQITWYNVISEAYSRAGSTRPAISTHPLIPAIAAHRAARKHLLISAARHDIPVLRWDRLVCGYESCRDELQPAFSEIPSINVDSLAYNLTETSADFDAEGRSVDFLRLWNEIRGKSRGAKP